MLIPMEIVLMLTPTSLISRTTKHSLIINSLSFSPSIISCSSPSQKPQGENNSNNNGDNKSSSTDWNKAWSSFKKQSSSMKSNNKKKVSQFSPDKYVTWNPRPSNYPLSEEIDPIKRSEKSNLVIWTSPRFTLFGAIVIVSVLLIYTVLAPFK